MNRNAVIAYALLLMLLSLITLWSGCEQTGDANPFPVIADWNIDTVFTEPRQFSPGGFGQVFARVVDSENDTIPYILQDMEVKFSSSIGDSIFLDTLDFTDDDGWASVFVSLNGIDTTETLIVLTATIEYPRTHSKRYYLRVNKAMAYADDIELEIVPDTLTANTADSAYATVTVLDSTGSAISGIPVNFSRLTTNFSLPRGPFLTNDYGQVTFGIQAGEEIGEAILKAYVYDYNGEQIADTGYFYFAPMPEISRVELNADPAEITANGSDETRIYAYVYMGEAQLPVPDGTAVTFSASDGTFVTHTFARSLNSSRASLPDKKIVTDQLDKNIVGYTKAGKPIFQGFKSTMEEQDEVVAYTSGGVAEVYLASSTTAGSVTVSVSCDSISDSLYVDFLPGNPHRLTISVRDSSIIADGEDTTSIFVSVFDRFDNPVSMGHIITFETDLGTVVPTTVTTNTLGQVRTVLRSANTSGLATINASYSSSVFSQIQVTFESTIPRYIMLRAEPAMITADGTSRATLSAQCLDENHIPVTDGVPIKFESSIGELTEAPTFAARKKEILSKAEILTRKYGIKPIDISNSSDIAIFDPSESSEMLEETSIYYSHTVDGYATVDLIAGTIADTCIIYAVHDASGNSDTTHVAFLPGSPHHLAVTFSRDTVWANNNDTSRVFAQVFDVYNNPVTSGYSVEFEVSAGSVFPTTQFTNDNGIAEVLYTSSLQPGYNYINASTGTAVGMGPIYQRPSIPRYVTLEQSSFELPADGSSENILTALVYDSDHRPISNGTRVNFASVLGEFSSVAFYAREIDSGDLRTFETSRGTAVSLSTMDILEETDSYLSNTVDGRTQVILTAPVIAGLDTVRAYVDGDSGSVADTVYCSYISGDIENIVLTASPSIIIADGSSTCEITARVYDSFGNPVGAGNYVEFTTTRGTILERQVTDSTGTAVTTLTSSTSIGVAQVEGTCGSASNLVNVDFVASLPNEIILSRSHPSMSVDGGIDTITATVLDSLGEPVSDDIPVDFTSVIGDIRPNRVRTTDGVAIAILHPDGIIGIDTVIAVAGPIADSITVNITSGMPNRMELYSTIDTLPADGVSTTNVWAVLYDATDTPVGSGFTVTFETTQGRISSPSNTDSSGIAMTTFTSSSVIGTAAVTARYGSLSGTIPITMVSSDVDDIQIIPHRMEFGLDDVDTIDIVVRDAAGFSVSDSTMITVTSDLCRVEPRNIYTIDGIAQAYLRPMSDIGTDLVIATAGGISDSVYLEVKPGHAALVELNADPDSIYANGMARSRIEALVTDVHGHPVGAGIPVNFSVPAGDGSINPTSVTNDSGYAWSELTSSNTPGIIWVTVSLADTSNMVPVTYLSSSANSIYLTAGDYTISSSEITDLRAVVRDTLGSVISDDTPVYFYSNFGVIDPPIGRTVDGVVNASYNPNRIIGVDTIFAEVGSLRDTIYINVTGGAPALINVWAVPETLYANGLSYGDVYAQVFDEFGNPVGRGAPVNFECTPIGTISPASVTNDSSIAQVRITSETTPGITSVHASSGSADGYATVVFAESPAAIVNLYASDIFINIGETVNLTAIVSDLDTLPITDNTAVIFSSTISEINPIIARTLGGEATAELIPTTSIGVDTVIATVGAATDTVFVHIGPGEPAIITISSDLDTLYANGFSTTQVHANVYDAFGNSVGYGVMVDFGCSPYGSIDEENLTDSSGVATVTLTAGNEVGVTRVTASASAEVTAMKQIHFISAGAGRVTLRADAMSMTIEESNNINATVLDTMDLPIAAGTRVYFSSSRSIITPAIGFTDTDGQTNAVLEPIGSAGVDTIVAVVDTVSDTLIITINPGEPAEIEMWVSEDTIPADGFSESIIYARIFDILGNPVRSGVAVDFVPTLGSVSPTTAYTDASGECEVILTSTMTSGLSTIRATSGTASQQVQVRFIATTVSDIILSLDNNVVNIGDETGNAITALVLDGSGNLVSDGTRVNFSADYGIANPPISTTTGGIATSNYMPGTVAGSDTIRASVGAVEEQTKVTVLAGLVQTIRLSANPIQISNDGRSRSRITGELEDFYGNPVPAGRNVIFSTSMGSILSPMSTDSLGHISTILTSSTDLGTAIISGQCEEGYGTVEVEYVESEVAYMNLIAAEREIVADGLSSTEITARVLDEEALPVESGIVEFVSYRFGTRIPMGEIDSIAPIGSSTAGEASAMLISETTVDTCVIIGSVVGTGISDSIIVIFIPGEPNEIIATAADSVLPADGLSSTDITATVFDEYGNFVEHGTEVTFNTSLGEVDPNIGWTDDSGRVTIELISENTTGRATVTVQSGSAVTFTRVRFSELIAARIQIISDSLSIVANGVSRTNISATVLDSLDTPVPDGTPIRFYTTDGILLPTVAYTEDATANSVLRSSVTVDTVYVYAQASAGVTSDTLAIYFRPGEPANIVVVADEATIPADGDSTIEVHATVTDMGGNVVALGTRVNFTSTLGSIDSTSYTDAAGIATTRFRAGFTPGVALLVANSGEAIGQTSVAIGNTNIGEIYVNAEPNRLIANGSDVATIEGRALNLEGAPISEDSPIRLELSDPTMGSVVPSIARTDSLGWFYADYQSPITSGEVWVRAYDVTNPAESSAVRIELEPGPPNNIDFEIEHPTIDANAISSTDIVAIVTDRYGNLVSSGIPVSFTASLGEIENGVTNSAGRATVTLTSGLEFGECRVVASSEEAREDTVVIFNNTDAAFVAVRTADPSLPADGFSTTMVEATVTDSSGSYVSDGTIVSFSVNPDTAGIILIPYRAYTTDGIAMCQLRAGTIPGRFEVIGESNGITGSSTLDLLSGDPHTIDIVAADTIIRADGVSTTDITVTVYDRFGHSIGSGQPVTINATNGTIYPTTINTDTDGTVVTTLTSSNVPGISRVSAACGSAYGTTDVEFIEIEVAYLSIIANPIRIIADGSSVSTIKAKALNELGLAVSGEIVYLRSVDSTSIATRFGTMDTLAVTNSLGEVEIDLVSESRTGTALVSARVHSSDTLYDSTKVYFIAGDVATILASSNPTQLYGNGSDTSRITITVLDEFDNIVGAGQRIDLTTDLGSIFPATTYTDGTSEIYATYTAANSLGRATITVQAGGISAFTSVELIESIVDDLELVVDSISLIANGFSTSRVRAIALDADGRNVPDSTQVTFSVNHGRMNPRIAYTVDGVATTEYVAGTDPDIDPIIQASAGITVSDTIELRAGPPANIAVIPDTVILKANGTDTTLVHVFVTDAFGSPVEESFEISANASLGEIDELAYLSYIVVPPSDTITGYAELLFTSGTNTGTALITVECEDASIGFASIDLTDPDIDIVEVNVADFELVADGRSSTEVTGDVRNSSGLPVSDGTRVNFEVIPVDSSGSITPMYAYTLGGDFSATYTSGTKVQRVNLRAYCTGTSGTVDDTAMVDLNPGDPNSIEFYDSTGTLLPVLSGIALPADGDSYVELTGFVYDRYHNPVGVGQTVSIRTSRGTLDGGLTTISVTTQPDGSFNFTLTSDLSAGTARITATCGESSNAVEVDFLESVPNEVILTAGQYIVDADGFSEIELTARVLDTLGMPITDRTRVVFQFLPDASNMGLSYGELLPDAAFTEDGETRINYRAGEDACEIRIQAGVGGITDEITMRLVPGQVTDIVLTAEDSTISANGRDNTLITATCFDIMGNEVNAGINVTFNTTLGTLAPLTTRTNSNGEAFTTLTSGTEFGTSRVYASVLTDAGEVVEVINIDLQQSAISIIDISLSDADRHLTANGYDNTFVNVYVFDEDGSPVTDGTLVEFAVDSTRDIGSILSPKLTNDGFAQTTFTAGTYVDSTTADPLEYIYVTVHDSVSGLDVVDSAWIILDPGQVENIQVYTDTTTFTDGEHVDADGTSTIRVYSILRDNFGNRLGSGENVTFSTDLGQFPVASAVTNNLGVAWQNLHAPYTPGIANITVSSGEVSGYGEVIFDETVANDIYLTAGKVNLTADGQDNTELTAEVYTADGTTVSDGTIIEFTVSEANRVSLLPRIATTENGIVTITVRADTIADGGFNIEAENPATSATGMITMKTIAGRAASVEIVSVSDDTLAADGSQNSVIVCTAKDQYHNTLPPGTPFNFEANIGSFDIPNVFSRFDSTALNTYTSGTVPGNDLITVTCDTAKAYLSIVLDTLTASTLILSSERTSMLADGSENIELQALVQDADGNPVADDSRVTFTVRDVAGLAPGYINPRIARTVSGIATAELTGLRTKGTCRVIASASATVLDSIEITLLPGEPATIVFDTTVGYIPGTGFDFNADGTNYTIRAYVYDEHGNGVDVGTPVTFTTLPALGEIISPAYVLDGSGLVETNFYSNTIGSTYLRATSGTANSRLVRCDFSGITGDDLVVSLSKSRLIADGADNAVLVAYVSETTGSGIRPVSDSTNVSLSIESGVIDPLVAYTANGRITANITSSTISTYPDSVEVNVYVHATLEESVFIKYIPDEPSYVEFISAPTDMRADGEHSETLTVEITDQYGNPVLAGVAVEFDTTAGSGSLSPRRTVTNDDGQATTILTSSRESGIVTISATTDNGASGYVVINYNAVTGDSLDLVAIPLSATANGADSIQLQALVMDSGTGDLVSDGSVVRFTTTNGFIRPSTATTIDGMAITYLYTSYTPDSTVTVVANGGSTAIDTVIVEFIPGDPYTIEIDSQDSISLHANGLSSTNINLTVYDEFGNHVREGIAINYTLSNDSLGAVLPTTGYTDENGQHTVNFRSSSNVGWAEIVATCTGDGYDVDNRAFVQLISNVAAVVELSVIPSRIVVGSTTPGNISVTVTDSHDDPVANGYPVRLSDLNLGIVDDVLISTIDGRATTTYLPLTNTGLDTLQATSGIIHDYEMIQFMPDDPDYMLLTADSSSLTADGISTSNINITVYDQFGNTVGEGVTIDMTVAPNDSFGSVSTPVVTNTSGVAVAEYTAGSEVGRATIRASVDGVEGVAQITLNPTDVGSLILTNRGASVLPADGDSTTILQCLVLDSDDLPITNGTAIEFSATTRPAGIPIFLYPYIDHTDTGFAFTALTAPAVVCTITVKAYYNGTPSDSSNAITIYAVPGEPYNISFQNPASTSLTADGLETYNDAVVVTDYSGNVLPSQLVDLDITSGSVSPTSVVTDITGTAAFVVTAPTAIGTGVLTATTYTDDGDTVQAQKAFQYTTTGVGTISLTASPRTIAADGGLDSSVVRAILVDASGDPVSDGLIVNFECNLGVIPRSAVTMDGIAEVVYRSSDISGNEVITATCGGRTATTNITLTASIPNEISIDITPDNNQVASSSTNTINIEVLDTRSNPVEVNSVVTLTVSDSMFGAVDDDVLLTDASGEATTNFIPGTKSGTCWITATCGTVVDSTYIIISAGAAHTMEFEVSNPAIYVRGAGEIDQTTVYAYVYDMFGNLVSDGTNVDFEIIAYPSPSVINPEMIPGNLFDPLESQTRTTTDGMAYVGCRAGSKAGTIEIEATTGTIVSSAPRITIRSGLPNTISVSRELCNVRGWDIDGVENQITAIVVDEYMNPVAEGTAVYFTCDEGVVTGAATTDSVGFAHATWYSSDPRGGADPGIINVVARIDVSAGSVTDTTWFYSSGVPASIVDLNPTHRVRWADNDTENSTDVRATFIDINGNPVSDGNFSAVFTSDVGTITSPVTITYSCGDLYAEAVSTYTPENVAYDSDPTSAIPGKVWVADLMVEWGGLSETDSVILHHGVADGTESTIAATSEFPSSGGTGYVIMNVRDIYTNPIGGDTVTLTSTSGSIAFASSTLTTSIAGYATTTFTVPANVSTEDMPYTILAEINSSGVVLNADLTVAAAAKAFRPLHGYSERDLEIMEYFGLTPETMIVPPGEKARVLTPVSENIE